MVCKDFVLSHGEKSVLLALTSHADRNSFEAFPSVATLARHTSMGRTAVKHALRKLIDRKLITPQGATRGGRGCSTRYLISPEANPKPVGRMTSLEDQKGSDLTSKGVGFDSKPVARVTTKGFKGKREGEDSLLDLDPEMAKKLWVAYCEEVNPGPNYFFTHPRKEMLAARYRETVSHGKTPHEAHLHLAEAIMAFSADDYHMGRKKAFEGVCRKGFEEIFRSQEVFEEWCLRYHHAEP
jgi:hypothetical protein